MSSPLKFNSKRIQRFFNGEFPHLIPVKTYLLVKPAHEHFLEGLLIEHTPYKATYYVWSVLSPTWSSLGFAKLNYSERVAHLVNFETNPEQVAAEIVATVRSDDRYLSRCQGPSKSPETALREAGLIVDGWREITASNLLFDTCVAKLIMGDADTLSAFQHFISWMTGYEHHQSELAIQLAAALECGRGEAMTVLHDAETAFRERIGLNLPPQGETQQANLVSRHETAVTPRTPRRAAAPSPPRPARHRW